MRWRSIDPSRKYPDVQPLPFTIGRLCQELPAFGLKKPSKATIEVKGTEVTTLSTADGDFISLTDMLKANDGDSVMSDLQRNGIQSSSWASQKRFTPLLLIPANSPQLEAKLASRTQAGLGGFTQQTCILQTCRLNLIFVGTSFFGILQELNESESRLVV